MKFFVLSLVSLLSVSAMAGSRCVQQASDAELINELAYRLRTPGPQSYIPATPTYSFTCDVYGEMTALTIDPQTGAVKTTKLNLDSNAGCKNSKAVLEAKIGQNRQGVIIAASCDVYGTMKKVTLSVDKVTAENINLGNSSQCNEAAGVINK